MRVKQTDGRFRWLCLAILLVAFAARVYRLDHQSFWNDEGNSASLSSRSPQLIIEGTASDVHPPLYYLTLRAWWPLAGQSDFSLRYLSVMAGLFQVAAVIAIGRMWLSPSGALGAGLLVALSPPLVYYGQEARMYALLGAVAAVSMWALWAGLSTNRRRFVIGFGALTALGMYTHYVYPAVVAAQGIIVLMFVGAKSTEPLRHIWQQGRVWLGAVALALLAYAPWMPIFLRTGSSTRTAGDASPADFLKETALWLVGGPFARFDVGGWLYVMVLLMFCAGLIAISNQTYSPKVTAAIVWLLVPIALMQLVGATDDNYRKFLTVSVPAVWLIVMLGAEWLKGLFPTWRSLRLGWFILFSGLLLSLGLEDLYRNPETFRDDYKGIYALIQREDRPNAAIVLNAPNQWEVFTWYAGTAGPLTLYPMPKSLQSDEKTRQEVEALLAKHDFVYALFWGFEGFDPNRVVERTLDELAFKSTDEWFGEVRLATYGVLGDFLPDGTNPPDFEPQAEFVLSDEALSSSGIRLNWVELSGSEFRPGDVIGLALQWESIEPVNGRYKVFVQLLDDTGQLVAQRDAEPVGNLKPTDSWQLGELVLDQHGLLLPADLPPGSYDLVIGLYDIFPPNGRLLSGPEQADFIQLAPILVQ